MLVMSNAAIRMPFKPILQWIRRLTASFWLRRNPYITATVLAPLAAALLLTCEIARCDEAMSADSAATSDAASAGSGFSLPFAFFDRNFGIAGGYIDVRNGVLQPQASTLGALMVGTGGSALAFFMGRDIRIFGIDRLFVDPIGSVGYYRNFDAYIDGNTSFVGHRAGANNSSVHNFVSGNGWDNYFRARFKYLLPIGNGREEIVPSYHLADGLLVDGATGGQAFNPLASGRTFIEIRPFYRSESIKGEPVSTDISTNGADAILFWDNRDFPANPSCGNSLTLQASHDFGAFSSSTSWTNYSAEYDQYFSLGESQSFRQRVLALDFWTTNSPTWRQNQNGTINHGPPQYAGGSLGGLFRMRAFPTERFSDKSAAYASTELRVIPDWNPFNAFPRFQEKVGVGWIQLVGLVEAGRVGSSWTLGALRDDWKWDAGFGLRVWAKGLVVRLDVAYGNEGAGALMMVSQPFQF